MYLTGDHAMSLIVDLLGDQFVATKKIQAIKLVRGLTNLGLRESKNLVEDHNNNRFFLENREPASTRDNRLKALRQIRGTISEIESLVDAQTDRFAPEPGVGAVITFNHQYRPGEKVYTYVALRVDGGSWALTGDDERYRWADLQQRFKALRSTDTFAYLS